MTAANNMIAATRTGVDAVRGAEPDRADHEQPAPAHPITERAHRDQELARANPKMSNIQSCWVPLGARSSLMNGTVR